jgi:hypothetical protein
VANDSPQTNKKNLRLSRAAVNCYAATGGNVLAATLAELDDTIALKGV